MLREITEADGEIIFFIDELHTLVGAGAAEGAMDAANLLKPALARGELRCIGATTLDEYRKHVEKDAALERRFQPVFVEEPTVEDTIAILRGLKERYEVHHGVRIKDSALVAAAMLSHRYIADRFLPDKAIDLVDEAASRLRIEIDSMPTEIDEIERRDHAARDRAGRARRRRTTQPSRSASSALDREIAELQERPALKAHWQGEKDAIGASGRSRRRSRRADARPTPSARRPRPGGRDPVRQDPEVEQQLEAGNARLAEQHEQDGSSRRRSTRRTSPRSSPSGPGSR